MIRCVFALWMMMQGIADPLAVYGSANGDPLRHTEMP